MAGQFFQSLKSSAFAVNGGDAGAEAFSAGQCFDLVARAQAQHARQVFIFIAANTAVLIGKKSVHGSSSRLHCSHYNTSFASRQTAAFTEC